MEWMPWLYRSVWASVVLAVFSEVLLWQQVLSESPSPASEGWGTLYPGKSMGAPTMDTPLWALHSWRISKSGWTRFWAPWWSCSVLIHCRGVGQGEGPFQLKTILWSSVCLILTHGAVGRREDTEYPSPPLPKPTSHISLTQRYALACTNTRSGYATSPALIHQQLSHTHAQRFNSPPQH